MLRKYTKTINRILTLEPYIIRAPVLSMVDQSPFQGRLYNYIKCFTNAHVVDSSNSHVLTKWCSLNRMVLSFYKIVLGVLDIVQPLFNFYTAFGFLLTLLCGFFVTPTLSPVIVPKYKDLERHKKAYWNTLLASTIHAVILTVVTIYLLMFDRLGEEYIVSSSAYGRALVRFSEGYFCADTILVMLDSKMRRDTLSVLHHALGVIGIWLTIYFDGVALYWVVYRFIMESSTPFVNFLQCMNTIGHPKQSLLYAANSLMLMTAFYSSRILIIPYHWFGLYFYVYLDPSTTMLWPVIIRYWVVVTFLLFDVINLIWAYRLTKGGCKVLRQLQKSSE